MRSRSHTQRDTSFKWHLLIGFLVLLSITIVAVSLYYLTRLSQVTITEVEVSGGETIALEEVKRDVQDELQGTYFRIIPRSFAFLYPHDSIMNTLSAIPRMYDISVERTSFKSLSISFKEYIPHALWCTESTENQTCYFVSPEGYAFAEAPHLKGGSLIRHSVEGVTEITPGNVIDVQTLTKIDDFILRVEQELGFRITELLHKKNGDIYFSVNGGGAIYVAESKDFGTTFENLKSVLVSKEFKHIHPGNFKYIDARFDNKVFVNERMNDPVSTTTASTTNLSE